MKPKFFFIIAFTLAAWGFSGVSQAFAQTPKTLPLVPATGVVQTATGLTGWCGQDFVLLAQEQVGNQWSARLVRLSSEPTNRAVRFFIYSANGKILFAGINPDGGTKTGTPSAFVENPAGFWNTFAWTAEVVYKLWPGHDTLVVIIRQAKQDCLLTRVLFSGFSGKG